MRHQVDRCGKQATGCGAERQPGPVWRDTGRNATGERSRDIGGSRGNASEASVARGLRGEERRKPATKVAVRYRPPHHVSDEGRAHRTKQTTRRDRKLARLPGWAMVRRRTDRPGHRIDDRPQPLARRETGSVCNATRCRATLGPNRGPRDRRTSTETPGDGDMSPLVRTGDSGSARQQIMCTRRVHVSRETWGPERLDVFAALVYVVNARPAQSRTGDPPRCSPTAHPRGLFHSPEPLLRGCSPQQVRTAPSLLRRSATQLCPL